MCSNGITLIALVVTIVVLLILAGVSINAILGDNGIIAQAKKAAEAAKDAATNDEENLGMLVDELDEIIAQNLPNTVKEAIETGEIFTVNKKITDEAGDTMTVPKGFKVKEGDTIQDGVVIADSEGNEFVWIPCKEGDYKKHAYEVTITDDVGKNVADGENNDKGWNTHTYRAYKDWKEEADETENKKSVEKNKGFYIARYEAGVPSNADFYVDASSGHKTYQESKNNIGSDLKPVSKKGVQAWNLISQTNALEASRRMYSGDNYGVRSQLVDGTAWDTAVTWILKDIKYSGIEKDSTTYGNYANNRVEATKIKENNCLFAEHLYKYKKSGREMVGWCVSAQ